MRLQVERLWLNAHGRTTAIWLALLVVLGACEEQAPVAQGPAPIRVQTVAMAPLEETRRYVGVIQPRHESDLGFRIAGKISERLVDVGERVVPGQVIARLDSTDLRLALEAEEAALAAARSARDQAVAEEVRYRRLLAEGHVASAAFEQRSARAAEARGRHEQVLRAAAVARNRLAYADLRSDSAGVVAEVFVEAGQVVAAGRPIARIARLDMLEAVASIPEHERGGLASSHAGIELWAAPGVVYDASLRELSPEADPASRTYEARFLLDRPDEKVTLGMSATVVLTKASAKPIARLPLSAVMNDGRGAMVWILNQEGDHVVRQPVVVAAFRQNDVLIASGLEPGQRVATLGVHKLDEGMAVRVVEEQTPAHDLIATR